MVIVNLHSIIESNVIEIEIEIKSSILYRLNGININVTQPKLDGSMVASF